MAIIVNGERIDDGVIQQEAERMRPRFEQAFQDEDAEQREGGPGQDRGEPDQGRTVAAGRNHRTGGGHSAPPGRGHGGGFGDDADRLGPQRELVEPVEGALTVNLGDMLRVWSNDRYRSPVHRVLAQSDRDRYSAPFFLNPRYDTVCEPLLEGPYRHDAPRFRPVSWAHFRDRRSAGDFADDGAEIQVDDFLVAETVAAST